MMMLLFFVIFGIFVDRVGDDVDDDVDGESVMVVEGTSIVMITC